VELEAEGDRKMLESLLQSLKYGPPGASVEKIDVSWSKFNGSYKCFDVRY
jgi:acylphosphatase